VSDSRKKSIAEINSQIKDFVQVYFDSLKLKSIPEPFKKELKKIFERKYELVVIGNTNVGKSTFLN
jgi:ribosome biogenesis GTPase A